MKHVISLKNELRMILKLKDSKKGKNWQSKRAPGRRREPFCCSKEELYEKGAYEFFLGVSPIAG